MANRSKGGRGRSRKRRSGGRAKPAAAVAGAEAAQAEQASEGRSPSASASGASASKATAGERSGRRPRAQRRGGAQVPVDGYRAPGSVGERPRAPWHPFPLAELSILVGLIAVAIGAARGEAGKTLLLVGVLVVVLGTLDTTIREHLSGYRSHAGLLAAVPTALVHGGIALGLFALGAPRVTWVLVPIVLDVPLFSVLLKLLRARFDAARRERVFAGRR
ncbi:MAG TPA: hypothetical protein VLJ80_03265 [Solirubrobacteraceae bacterium]|nr:hypothetical protein [Solirubrobacteraceae bacterium]